MIAQANGQTTISVWLALIGMIGTLGLAVIGQLALWLKAKEAERAAKDAKDLTADTTAKTGEKLQEIHVLVNSRQALMDNKQKEQETRIIELTKQVADLQALAKSTLKAQDVKDAYQHGQEDTTKGTP